MRAGRAVAPMTAPGRRDVWAAAASALIVAVAGGLLTDLSPWYLELKQPAWKPPDWAFGPVWSVVLTMWAVSLVLSWRAAPTDRLRGSITLFYGINGVFNIVWSALFFTFKRPDWALVEAGLLWLSVAYLVWLTWRLDRRASLLLTPYLVWVIIAMALNWRVVQLNQPF